MSRGKWKPYSYLVKISHEIAAAVAEGNRKLIITAPPRHGKSELCSQWVPVWYLTNWPDKHVLLASYGAELATKFGRWCRNTISEHADELGVNISPDSSSVSRWHTIAGGSMVSLGVGGSVTGRGADLIIADDLTKNIADAQSPAVQKNLREWFKSTLFTRLEPNASFILVQTRWRGDDLIGFLKDEHPGEWTEIKLPAIAEENDFVLRNPGEALCPERFNIQELRKKRDQIGPQLFDAMYQQNPSTASTQMFPTNWWQHYQKKNQPDFNAVIQSWDCGYIKTETSSYSVCATIGSTEDEYYILDIFRARLEFPELIRAVKNNYARHRPNWILIESEASGISVIQTLYDETQLPIKAINLRNKTKTERAWEITHLVESGNVYLPEDSPWLQDFLEEITLFPQSKYSDQVDAFTQGLYFLKNSSRSWARRSPRVTIRPSTGREELYPDSKLGPATGKGLFKDWLDSDRQFMIR